MQYLLSDNQIAYCTDAFKGITAGLGEFGLNMLHGYQTSAHYTGLEHFDFSHNERSDLTYSLASTQSERHSAFSNAAMQLLSVDSSNSTYHAFRSGTVTALEVSSLAYAGYGLYRGLSGISTLTPPQPFKLNRFHAAARNLSEVGQNNIRILRGWAKSKGWERAPNLNGGPESWGKFNSSSGGFNWNLKIKPEISLRPGLQPGSAIPRASVRIGESAFINPFTGERVSKAVGGHIPLEELYY